jgi:small-conductance mechanosensitive channel
MSVVDSFNAAVGSIIAFLPSLIAAIIILIIAWIIGRALGRLVSSALDRVGVDDALRRTVIGKSIESSGTSIRHVFDLIVRWFIYIIGIMAAVNVLGIPMLTAFTQSVVLYIPNIIAALIVLVIGFIFADIVGDLIRKTGTASEVPYMGIFSTAIEVFLYFIVIIIALDQLRINTSIIYVFATALAWGIAIGAGVGLGIALGIGLKDRIPRLLEGISGEEAKQRLQKMEEAAHPSPEPVSRPARPARKPGAVPE